MPPKITHFVALRNGADTADINPLAAADLATVEAALARPVLEGGLTELIDRDDAATAADQYTKSVGVALAGTYSGEILSFLLVASEAGSGAVIANAMTVFILDADPAVSAADTALAAAGAEHKTVLGKIDIATTDWNADANGAVCVKTVGIPFHAVGTLYFVARLATGSTTVNSAAGDDEELHFNFWYRRDS